jgi:hypothetical protein
MSGEHDRRRPSTLDAYRFACERRECGQTIDDTMRMVEASFTQLTQHGLLRVRQALEHDATKSAETGCDVLAFEDDRGPLGEPITIGLHNGEYNEASLSLEDAEALVAELQECIAKVRAR